MLLNETADTMSCETTADYDQVVDFMISHNLDPAMLAKLYQHKISTDDSCRRLTIDTDHRIFLPDGREVKLCARDKALYLLFLDRKSMRLVDLPDHRKTLERYYRDLLMVGHENYSNEERVHEKIGKLVDLMHTEPLNQAMSRIRKTFIDMVGKAAAESYCIKGLRGGIYSVDVAESDNVEWGWEVDAC